MREEDFKSLQTGDIVKHKSTQEPLIVTTNYGGRVTAMQTYDLTNPNEWNLILKADYKKQ